MGIRRTSHQTIPARRADQDAGRRFDPNTVLVPHENSDYSRCIDVDYEALDSGAILSLVSAALHPDETLSVRAIELLGDVPGKVLEEFQGYLRALFDTLLDRRDTDGLLLTPAIEVFLDQVPFFPDAQTHLPGLLPVESPAWTEEIQEFIASDDALEDPAYPHLLEVLERFPDLHDEAMERLSEGVAPRLEAARHIAETYVPALLPLVHHESEDVRRGVQEEAVARMAEISLPTEAGELRGWSAKRAITENLDVIDAGLARLVIEENRLDLVPAVLASRAARLLKDLAARDELYRFDPMLEGHQLILMAAARSTADEFSVSTVRRLTAIIVTYDYPPPILAALMRHEIVDDGLLEEVLRHIIEKSRRTIDQARKLSVGCFPHERAPFRRVMVEGYRRTIGSWHLVEAVFMATPPDALQEALDFLLINHALSLPALVRRWVDAHPDARGRVHVTPATLYTLSQDRSPAMRAAAEMLRGFAAT